MADQLQRKLYTEKELRDMRRVDIRTIASEWYKMDPKECSKKSTSDVVEYILEQQKEEYESKGNAPEKGKKGKVLSMKGKVTTKKTAKEPEPEVEKEEPEVLEGDLGTKVDALGQAIDNNFQSISQLDATLKEVNKNVFIIMGLCHSLFVANEGEDELNERITELEELWEQEGNG